MADSDLVRLALAGLVPCSAVGVDLWPVRPRGAAEHPVPGLIEVVLKTLSVDPLMTSGVDHELPAHENVGEVACRRLQDDVVNRASSTQAERFRGDDEKVRLLAGGDAPDLICQSESARTVDCRHLKELARIEDRVGRRADS